MHVTIRLYQVLYDIISRVEKYRRSLFSHPLLMTSKATHLATAASNLWLHP